MMQQIDPASNSYVNIHVTVDDFHQPSMNLKFRNPPTYQEVTDILMDRHGRLRTIRIRDGTVNAFDICMNEVLDFVDARLDFQYRCECKRETGPGK
jgi:hypothetical protein